MPAVRMLFDRKNGGFVRFIINKEARRFIESEAAFAPLSKPFSPDHIVYCKAYPLYVKWKENLKEQLDLIEQAHNDYVEKYGFSPMVIAVEKLGFFVCGKSLKEAQTAGLLLIDSMKIAVYSKAFGGYLPMKEDLVDFISTWEVERYRSGIANGTTDSKRLSGKIAIVTGGAQGFGKEIASALAEQGAHIVVADLNSEGAVLCASGINEKYGAGTAVSIHTDVADEQSVEAMVNEAVFQYGGLDILVSNAGIVRAGGLEEITKETFDLVTAVNYTSYFLCTKYASRVMKIQRRFAPEFMTDIIEINSKSGLSGSNKNFAYAGSKFGGLGLTQSFALELAPFGIKVNAVCPGNFLDGPLWSDPDKGLFVQYLNAGKVPGAKTAEDIKHYYESRVPLGRGCSAEDVVRAILYLIEQKYETGQALPVTGGQIMLS